MNGCLGAQKQLRCKLKSLSAINHGKKDFADPSHRAVFAGILLVSNSLTENGIDVAVNVRKFSFEEDNLTAKKQQQTGASFSV